MQKLARAALLVITSLLASVVLSVASAFAAALAFGAVALIVPGTGTHNVTTDTQYRDNAADRYISASGLPCTSTNGCDLVGVDYPASFWPIPLPGWCPGLTCDTWNESVGEGVTQLGNELTAVVRTVPADEDIIIFGYSQGGAVVSRAMYDIPEEQRDRISVVTIGNINNPQGLWSRLSFLRYIPLLNVSFGPQLPTDGIKSTNYSFEYDPVGDAPRYWGNPLAVLNALFAFDTVHGYYLDPNANSPTDSLPYGYDDASLAAAIAAAPKRVHGDATFVLIPQRGALPIFSPLIALGNATGTTALVEPLVRLLQPVTKLLIDLGYDRNADPGVPRNLSILPFNPFTFNPVQFSVDFVEAVVQGIQDAFRGSSMIAVPVPAPTENTSEDEQAGGAFVRLAASAEQDDLPAEDQTSTEQQISDDTTTDEELDGTSNDNAPVIPLPVVESQEKPELEAADESATDDDAVKEDELQQDDIADLDAEQVEEAAEDEATEGSLEQGDAEPAKEDAPGSAENSQSDGAGEDRESAAA